MLYHLLAPLARQHIIFNLFNYITFRAAGATVTALLVAFIVGPRIIGKLRDHRIGQIVRAEGPTSHHGKRGTPTMGGLIIILATVVPTLLWARLDSRYVLVAVAATLWMGLIGFLDDYLKIVRGQSQGLVARWKLVGQVSFGIGLGVYILLFPLTNSVEPNATQLPFFKYIVWVLPWPIYLAFVTFVTTASSNAVNLTDGLDGLAAGLTVIAVGAFAVFCYLFGRVDAARYLGVLHLPGAGELTIFCGAVFAAETLSVLIQTTTYKWRKRRYGKEYADAHKVFRMAPLHHHFEKLGWAEPQVVMRFYIMGVLCAMIALATLKVR